MIKAEIIADSKNEFGDRITTFVLNFPRIILAEFNTHRMFSRNSASSRAIPFDKMVEMVNTNPFIPIKWMKDHKGMQGNEYFTGVDCDIIKKEWLISRNNAVRQAMELNSIGVTKQIVNRLLEPYMWHKVIVTATEFENFFSLRANEQAEIHMQDLAEKMLFEYNNSQPKLLKGGEWHIPFGDLFEEDRIEKLYVPKLSEDNPDFYTRKKEWLEKTKVEIATSRCARISYNNFEGKDDYEADIKLHDKLLESGHVSPFEHCAMAMGTNYVSFLKTDASKTYNVESGWCGNFKGFIQYRKTLLNENRKDIRVRLK